MITGAAIIYATNEVLDKHLRQVRAEQSQLEDEVLPRFASEVGMSRDSAAFARFRKLSRSWKPDRLTPEELLDIRSLSRNLSQLDDEQLIKWATRLQGELKETSGPQAQIRNRVAFVSTIIRPLSTKWLSRWQAEGRDDISIDDAFDTARELLQFELDSKKDLAVFFEQVYSYFEQVVVFSGDSKPGGTVAESSKRAYAAAWSNFTIESPDEVWRVAESLRPLQVERMMETVIGSQGASNLIGLGGQQDPISSLTHLKKDNSISELMGLPSASDFRLETNRQVRYSAATQDSFTLSPLSGGKDQGISSLKPQGSQGAPGLESDLSFRSPYLPAETKPMVRIGVSSASAPELLAHRDWRSLADLKAGLLVWLGSLAQVWGDDAKTLSGKVESVSGESVLASIALPPSDASTFAERAIRVANF